MRNKVKTLHKERKVGNRGGKGYISLLNYWVNRYCAIYRIYNGVRTHLLLYSAMFCRFCHILPTTAMCWQCAAMYSNVLSTAICNALLYSAMVLPYFARVGLYGVGGMQWEWVVIYKVSCKVLQGGPVIKP